MSTTRNKEKLKLFPKNFQLLPSSWSKISHFFVDNKVKVRKTKYCYSFIFEAIMWINRTGCQWRNIDSKYGKWELIYSYFRKWSKLGLFEQINSYLIEERRLEMGKEKQASVLVIDSQSVKVPTFIEQETGIDGNKKVNGRKRVIAVDSMGNVINVVVHAANLSDNYGGIALVDKLAIKSQTERLEKVLVDAGYKVTFENYIEAKFDGRCKVEIAQKPESSFGFVPTKTRWLVERAFGIFNFFRRLSKDYEKTVLSSENMILIASIATLI